MALSLGAEGSILAQGGSLLLTLRVESLGSAESAPLPAVDVTLLLPAGVVTAEGWSGSLRWKGIPVAPGAPFVQTLHLQVEGAGGGDAQVVEVGATAAAAGYAEVATGLLLGVATEGARSPADAAAAAAVTVGEGGAAVTSADGEVVLLAPAGVLPTGATVQMTELFDGLAALAAATPTVGVAPSPAACRESVARRYPVAIAENSCTRSAISDTHSVAFATGCHLPSHTGCR